MAVTLTLVSRTPDMLKYQWVYDGLGGAGSGTVNRTQAQMIADCAGPGPSPLQALLASIASDGAWDALDLSPRLSLYQTINNLPAATSIDSEFEVIIGPGRVLQVAGKDGNAGRAVIEVRFNHTLTR